MGREREKEVTEEKKGMRRGFPEDGGEGNVGRIGKEEFEGRG